MTFEEYFEYKLYMAKISDDKETVKNLENIINDYNEFIQTRRN